MTKEKRKIINLCNSKIGVVGNIGLRTAFIINNLKAKQNISSFSISRGILNKSRQSYTYGVFKNIPSILNYIRVHFFKNFNHKYLDILIFDFFVLFYLRLIRPNKNDIIHLWEMSPKIIKYLNKKGCKIILDVPIAPHIYRQEIENQLYPKLSSNQNKVILESEKFCFNNVDLIIAPSLFVKNEILKYGIIESKLKVIPFGVDVDDYKKSFNSNKKGIDFCLAGVLNDRKGILFLLKAWEVGDFIEDRLHLCGRITPEIKSKIDSMKHNKNIIIPGFIDTSEYFKNCDVYVFPSLMEGSSKSIYEAMNRSMPIICTYESGSVIKDREHGFIIEKMNANDILVKMSIFKENKTLIEKMGSKSKVHVSEFSWQNYATNVISIYNEI
jgi:glycosyltransferase involved in cell wall biosynthesis